ncbi:hypothetical protein [Streptomyces sp. NPDC046985]|uniref:hypothetical protein n=1 Tax=Streptomyces sp. NPDC046985 TaxID=3155377 RepID=UPI0033DF1CC1
MAAVAAAVAVLCLLAATASVGSAAAAGAPGPYAFVDGAPSVDGAATASGAARLEPGRVYRSSLPADGRLYYGLRLHAASTVYVSATAVPGAGAAVSATDGLRLSLQDAGGASCSYQATRFGPDRSPHPIAAWAVREASPGHTLCQGAGRYTVLVERIGATGSSRDAWPLELTVATESPLRAAGATTAPAPGDSALPEPLAGQPADRAGGAGFAAAAVIGQGVWRTRIVPGRTLFYRVPVDWGRRLDATADIGAASTGGGYADGALTMSLYNPVRGYVEDAYAGYSGRAASTSLAPLPPVAYANRYGFADPVKAMRFAGSYYLVVHLAAQTADLFGAGPYAVTLRVRVSGTAQPGPGYAGRSEPRGLFEVTAGDRAAAAMGGAGGGAALRALAVGGIGAGTALLAVLGAWTVLARRRVGAAAGGGDLPESHRRVSAQKPTA